MRRRFILGLGIGALPFPARRRVPARFAVAVGIVALVGPSSRPRAPARPGPPFGPSPRLRRRIRPPSCRVGGSARSPTSTASFTPGCPGPTGAGTGSSAAARSIGSPKTGRRCSPSRRSCPTRPSGPPPACRATTTSRVLGSDYSVHPRAIGRRVDVRADLDVIRLWTDAGRRGRWLARTRTEHGRGEATAAKIGAPRRRTR
jgi:hypothetical protein